MARKTPMTKHSTVQPGSPPVPETISLSPPETNSSSVFHGMSTAFMVTPLLASHTPFFPVSNEQTVGVIFVTSSLAPGPTLPSPVSLHRIAVAPPVAFKSDNKSSPTVLDLIVTGDVIGAPFNNHSGPANAAADPIAQTANAATRAGPNSFTFLLLYP